MASWCQLPVPWQFRACGPQSETPTGTARCASRKTLTAQQPLEGGQNACTPSPPKNPASSPGKGTAGLKPRRGGFIPARPWRCRSPALHHRLACCCSLGACAGLKDPAPEMQTVPNHGGHAGLHHPLSQYTNPAKWTAGTLGESRRLPLSPHTPIASCRWGSARTRGPVQGAGGAWGRDVDGNLPCPSLHSGKPPLSVLDVSTITTQGGPQPFRNPSSGL